MFVLQHERRLDHVREVGWGMLARTCPERQNFGKICDVWSAYAKNQNFPQTLRLRIKICGSEFAVTKTKILAWAKWLSRRRRRRLQRRWHFSKVMQPFLPISAGYVQGMQRLSNHLGINGRGAGVGCGCSRRGVAAAASAGQSQCALQHNYGVCVCA